MIAQFRLRLDSTTRRRLDRLAKATGRSRTALATEAVRHYIELNEWQIDAIQNGLAQANRGHLIRHAALKSRWEKKLEELEGRSSRRVKHT